MDDSCSDEEIIKYKLLQNPVNLIELINISRSSKGFINNSIRQRVWPKLLGIDRYQIVDFYSQVRYNHRDENQVICDIDRSLWSINESCEWSFQLRERRRMVLFNIVMAVLSRNPQLYYYQGYHDIVGVFLMVLEDDYLTFKVVEAVTLKFLSDNMSEDFTIVSKIMKLIFNLIALEDRILYKFLLDSGIEPYFAMSWFITWFSHDIKDINFIAPIFDVLLCSHPLYCIYLCCAVISIYLLLHIFSFLFSYYYFIYI